MEQSFVGRQNYCSGEQSFLPELGTLASPCICGPHGALGPTATPGGAGRAARRVQPGVGRSSARYCLDPLTPTSSLSPICRAAAGCRPSTQTQRDKSMRAQASPRRRPMPQAQLPQRRPQHPHRWSLRRTCPRLPRPRRHRPPHHPRRNQRRTHSINLWKPPRGLICRRC